jgi:hypothetical protein
LDRGHSKVPGQLQPRGHEPLGSLDEIALAMVAADPRYAEEVLKDEFGREWGMEHEDW